jgi:hypothetical protein
MSADRNVVGNAAMLRTDGMTRDDFRVSISTTFQKIHVTKNNIGISCYGDATVNKKQRLDNCIYDFLDELDTEKYKTPYNVAQLLKDYFIKLDPDLETIFHVGGYDMTDERHPKPALYDVFIKQKICNKINCNEPYQGGSMCGSDFLNKILSEVNNSYRYFNLRDAIDFAKFVNETCRQMMRFQLRGQAISKEIDILILRPGCHEWLEG